MLEPVVIGILILAVLACVGWLGGGRKWAFRTVLAALVLVVISVAAILLYFFLADKLADHRGKKIHDCAVEKVADPKCEKVPPGERPVATNGVEIVEVCPPYTLSDNPSEQAEKDALALAEQECRAEMDPKEKSLHDQLSEYKRQHPQQVVKASGANSDEKGPWTKYQQTKSDIFDQLVKDCAAKVHKKYPQAYNDLDDETLVKKVLAKYPHYCSVGEGDPPGWEPVIENIR